MYCRIIEINEHIICIWRCHGYHTLRTEHLIVLSEFDSYCRAHLSEYILLYCGYVK